MADGSLLLIARRLTAEQQQTRLYRLDQAGTICDSMRVPDYVRASIAPTDAETIVVTGGTQLDVPGTFATELELSGEMRWILALDDGLGERAQSVMGPLITRSGTIYVYNSVAGLVALLGHEPLATRGWPVPRGDSGNCVRALVDLP